MDQSKLDAFRRSLESAWLFRACTVVPFLTCAFLRRPPVLPPKIGEGVSGLSSGCTQTFFTGLAGAAGAGATSAEARTDKR